MLAVMALKIELMPDWTIFVQLGIFISTMAVLHLLVFRPVLRIIDRRAQYTSDARADARDKNAEAERVEGERSLAISAVIKEGEQARERKLTEARKDAEKIVAEAREAARRMLDTTEVSVESSEEVAEMVIEVESEILADDIANRIRPAETRR